MRKLTDYKLRAECQVDVACMLKHVHVAKLHLQQHYLAPGAPIPDVTVSFTSSLTLAEIKDELREIPDGHVMVETVALAANYTGKRKEQ